MFMLHLLYPQFALLLYLVPGVRSCTSIRWELGGLQTLLIAL